MCDKSPRDFVPSGDFVYLYDVTPLIDDVMGIAGDVTSLRSYLRESRIKFILSLEQIYMLVIINRLKG